MDYDPSRIEVLPSLEAVRRRPGMYWGCGPDDPEFPGRVLREMVADALAEQPVCQPLKVEVTVLDDRRFRIADNGAELALHPKTQDVGSELVSLLTILHVGGWARWGVRLPVAVAVCSEVIAEVRVGGRRFRQRVTGRGAADPVEDLGAAEVARTVLEFRLDDDYLAVGSALPASPGRFLADLLDRTPSSGTSVMSRPSPLPGTELIVQDMR